MSDWMDSLAEVPGEPGPRVFPHRGGKNMAGSGFDETAETVRHTGGGIGVGDALYSGARLGDGAAPVVLAEIEVQGPWCAEGGDFGRVPVGQPAGDVVRKTVEQAVLVDRGVGRQATITDEGLEARFKRSHEPGVGRTHRVPVTSDAVGFHLGTRGEEVDRPAHVEDVFPSHALSLDEVTEEFEAFIISALVAFRRVLPLLKALGIGTEDNVTFPGEGGSGVVRGIARQPGRFAFPEMPLAVVLVPDGDRRSGMLGIHAIGNEKQGRDPLDDTIVEPARGLVGERFDAESLVLVCLPDHGMKRGGSGPGASKAYKKTGTEIFGAHVRDGGGGDGTRLREQPGERQSGGGLLQKEASVRIGHRGGKDATGMKKIWQDDNSVMLPFTDLSFSEGIKGCMKTSRLPCPRLLACLVSVFSMVGSLLAQGPPPPPPLQPLLPLLPPVAPAGNPITTDKVQLGKALFWDEQLSSTRTVACGTCHQPVAGGSDSRSTPTTLHPGPNGIFGNGDDIVGSPGVIATDGEGLQRLDDFFGMAAQVTGRYSPSAINAAYPPLLFWDGRATGTFTDPVSGEVVLAAGAALESQAAGPPTSSVEMAHAGRDWSAVASRLNHAVPLTLSPSVPTDLSTWIAGRDYAELFEASFGSAGVTPSRIIMAIATYERSLVSNQAPFDAFIAGTPGALTAQEQQGQNLFRTHGCAGCHAGNRLTDDVFHYIGVRPQGEDLGRSAVTGVNGNRGQFKTPSLRNVALRGEYMHNGRFNTLEEVVDFYNRGGDFDAPNKPPVIQPLGLTDTEKAALVAFLGRPLTDPRVAAETGPFSRPALSAGSAQTPVVSGEAAEDEVGNLPLVTAVEPALAGSANFTVGLSRVPVGSTVWLVIDDEPIVSFAGVPDAGAVTTRIRNHASLPAKAAAPERPVVRNTRE